MEVPRSPTAEDDGDGSGELRVLPTSPRPKPGLELFKALIDAVDSHAMVLLDERGHVASWNPGAQRIKGYTAGEIVGQSFEVFYPPEAIAVDHPGRELEHARLTGFYQEEGWRVRKDGTRFWARVLIVALRDGQGEVTGYGKVTSDLTEDRQRQEQVANTMRLLEQAIRIDNLTGLPNRRAWDERITEEIARARREKTPLTVAVVDLDHFKQVNDEHGHAEGDRLLKQASLAWRRVLRPTDILVRYGGEEFTVALPDTELDAAAVVLERVRAATPGAHTCSIGAALLAPSDAPLDLLGRADRTMYRAKNGGRDRVLVA